MNRLEKTLVCLLLSGLFLLASMPGKAGEKLSPREVENSLGKVGVRVSEVQGIEPLPIKEKVYMVFVRLANGRGAAFVMSEDARFLITGKVLDLSQGGKDLTMEVGYSKGYIPLPKGAEAKIKVDTTNSPAFGPDKAPKIIVFFDPLCPYCVRELRDLRSLAEAGKVRLVLKYFIVHGDRARRIARDSLCLYEKEKGKKEGFWTYLLSQGREKAQIQKCNSEQVEFILTRDGEEAKKLNLRGTPAAIINNKVYVGYLGRTVIDRLLLTGNDVKSK